MPAPMLMRDRSDVRPFAAVHAVADASVPAALATRGGWGVPSGNWDRGWVCAVINGANAGAGSRIG